MLDKFKQLFGRKASAAPPPEPPKIKKTRTRRAPAPPKEPQQPQVPSRDQRKTAATAAGEPWVEVTEFELDPQNWGNGSFTLDYNDKFVLNLIRAGYKLKDSDTDVQIVDRWFTDICRSVVLEHHEQMMADPQKRNDIRIVQTRNIGDGRSEVS